MKHYEYVLKELENFFRYDVERNSPVRVNKDKAVSLLESIYSMGESDIIFQAYTDDKNAMEQLIDRLESEE